MLDLLFIIGLLILGYHSFWLAVGVVLVVIALGAAS